MSHPRLKRLKEFVERNPNDAFAWYGLAMEYQSQEQYEQAIEAFAQLVQRTPDYVAAYFQYGMTLQEIGNVQKAIEVFQKGIQVASEKGDTHARDELVTVLNTLRGED